MRKSNDTIAVVEIGASKVICFIAEVNDGDLLIKGIGQSESKGVKAGLITDMQQAKQSVAKAIELASKMADCKVRVVSCALSSCILISKNLKTQISISGKEISKSDLTKLILGINNLIDSKEHEVLHNFIYNYKIDEYNGISNPIGMYGQELECDVNTVICYKNILLNYQQCFNQIGIEIQEFIASPIAVSYSIFTDEDHEHGALLIDLGYSSSSISYIKNKKMIFSDSIPLGSWHIVNDIAQVFGINFATAQKIKSLYGSLSSVNHESLFSSGMDIDLYDELDSTVCSYDMDEDQGDKKISKKLLNEVMQARLEEIVEMLDEKFKASGIRGLNNKLILTGGISSIDGIAKFLEKYNFKVKIQSPIYINGIADNVTGNAFSCAIGLLKYAQANYIKRKVQRDGRLSVGRMLTWLKENF